MNLKNKLLYHLGRHSKRLRLWYWRTYNHQYLWGISTALGDFQYNREEQKKFYNKAKENALKQFQKDIERAFSYDSPVRKSYTTNQKNNN